MKCYWVSIQDNSNDILYILYMNTEQSVNCDHFVFQMYSGFENYVLTFSFAIKPFNIDV